MSSVETCKCLANGEWYSPKVDRFADVWNPSDGSVIASVPLCDTDEVNRVVQTANDVFKNWRDTPVVDRAHFMFRFHALLMKNANSIANIVSKEHGKTFNEAKASVQRGIEVVEFACGIPSLMMGESLENIAPNVDSETIRYPLGVVAGITPFNFPAMVPLWMYPVAIVCGNCFVLKPSPRVPMSANVIGDLLIETGLPKGVFSIVHGDKTSVDALLHNPLVKAVSFVGSTPVAKYIYETGTANGKRVQAAGGAKNHLIIMPDADLDTAVHGVQHSAFGCAGERCMAGSIAMPIGDIADKLVERLCESAEKMTVGRTDNGGTVDMGPVISREHLQRVQSRVDQAESEGAKVSLDGRKLKISDAPEGFFIGPTVVDHVTPKMTIAREEVFGPVISVSRVDSLEDAIRLGDECEYGNGAVIFTQSGRAAREFKRRFNAGMIGINVGVPAPMAWFPFTGWNSSFFGDLHIQGREGILFYTQQRVTMTRWPEPKTRDMHDPVWRPGKP
jgi:malonate-semialdehyde dehydrogenase (acetylating) / methylmalonate-semialdehyde dehydrogenase